MFEHLKFIVWMHPTLLMCRFMLFPTVVEAQEQHRQSTRIARLGISTEDTYFFENAYPITLTANGDSIQIYNENANGAVNVLVLGDKEG